jgi:hypothetical protein
LACAFEQDFDRLIPEKIERQASVGGAVGCGRADPLAELNQVALANSPSVPHERTPAAGTFSLVERRADRGIAALAFQSSGNDPGIVENQQVAGAKLARQIADVQVTRFGGVEHQ